MVFFRAGSLNDAAHIISHTFVRPTPTRFFPMASVLKASPGEVAFSALLIVGLMAYETIGARINLRGRFQLQPAWVRWPAYYAFCMSIWLLGISTEAKAFIYFQF